MILSVSAIYVSVDWSIPLYFYILHITRKIHNNNGKMYIWILSQKQCYQSIYVKCKCIYSMCRKKGNKRRRYKYMYWTPNIHGNIYTYDFVFCSIILGFFCIYISQLTDQNGVSELPPLEFQPNMRS